MNGATSALNGLENRTSGMLEMGGGYIKFATINGSAPSSSDCDSAGEAGKTIVRTDGATNLYICTGATGWVGK
jgi:hypothetical protein